MKKNGLKLDDRGDRRKIYIRHHWFPVDLILFLSDLY